ncbi:MAG: heavy metal-responsive transcriptional regulator [Vampirovibrionales bacterium]|nr:heavy metal-responsive transcriptional regulator [Vampirovibrionales bacterium]
MTSGELAKQASVNVETLRYYEREQLLPAPSRTEAGYRMYGAQDLTRVRFIRRAQDLGFSLAEIRDLLALRHDASQSVGVVKQLAEHKIQTINEKIQSLEAMKAALTQLAQACPGDHGLVEDCPILKCLDSPHPSQQEISSCSKNS